MAQSNKEPQDSAADLTEAPELGQEKQEATAPGSDAWYEEKVPIKLFRDDARYTEDVFVRVKGQTFLIKRGVEVMVPRYVAQVLMDAQTQREQAAMNTDRLQNEFESASRAHGINI